MKKELIAPCGINCNLCVAYQFNEKNLNKKGFHKTYCMGCIPRGKNCTHQIGRKCQLLGQCKIRYCFQCENYPCKMLKNLDKRYKTKYHTSIIENLDDIKEKGIETFIKEQEEKWTCKKCGELICCHNGLCLNCDIDKLIQNKKYRWNEE